MSAQETKLRARLASLSALIAIGLIISAPWLLSQLSISTSRHLALPSSMTSAIPSSCQRLTLYVGYPGCNTECPRALQRLALQINERSRDTANPRDSCAVFLSLFPNQQEATQRFAAAFHPDLIGLSLSPDDLTPILNTLGLARMLAPDGSHRDSLYMLERRGGLNAWELILIEPAGR